MKRVFSMVVALTMAIMGHSQSSLVATLNHNGEISTFYGATALQEAHEASQHGDAITLSSGTFTAVNITKALTIRGAGMQVDSIAQILPTIISGNFRIGIPANIDQHLTMEGLYNNNTINVDSLNDASFLKCRFSSVSCDSRQRSRRNLTFVHCEILKGLVLSTSNTLATCVNCYVYHPSTYSNSAVSSNFDFLNCVLVLNNNVYNSSFVNCFISTTSSNIALSSTNSALCCLGKNENGSNMFSSVSGTTNTNFTGEWGTLFKTYTGTYSDDETFELTDAAKVLYRGNDVKQIGMYGGNVPFNPNTTNPRIVKCNVASESTADGKLSVDIEVSAAK